MREKTNRRQLYSRLIATAITVLLIMAIFAAWSVPSTVYSQSWPASWLLIDTDPNEPGAANYRDVSGAYFSNYDDDYLYLRLETYASPEITGRSSRFKWLIDVGNGNNLYWSGQNILGADYILFVEDNGSGVEVYLLDAQGDDRFSQYEPTAYMGTPGPITDTGVANYSLSLVDNSVYLWVSLSALGVSDLTHVSLLWATDQQNPNLEQGPILDSTDVSDTPISLDADLNVMKDVNNHIPNEGDQITYTVTVTNTGPATATNIEITDSLPTGVTYVSHSASPGIYTPGTGIWEITSLVNGADATLTINADVDSGPIGQTIINTAAVTAVDQPDPHTGDNSDSADIIRGGAVPELADLHLLKDVSDHNPREGDAITYTLTVTNTGPDDATGVQVADSLPGEVTYASHSGGPGTYDSGTDIWSVGDLADGASATLNITVTVNSGTAGSTITNTATATITTPPPNDPHSEDDSDTAEFFVCACAQVTQRGAPVFPNLYAGIAAAFLTAILAFRLRTKLLPLAKN